MLADNPVYQADVERTVRAFESLIRCFADTTVLVTGATGLIGSAVVDLLLCANRLFGTNTSLLAASRSADGVIARFGTQPLLTPIVYDATRANELPMHIDYIIHAASNASPEWYVSRPVETMLANFGGLHELLEHAVKCAVRRVLYVSSSEVYGGHSTLSPICETEYGGLDILNVRSAYAESKRATETLATAYAVEHGVDVVTARPGHIYGPTARKSDRRLSSDFAWRAAAGEALVMKSEGRDIRSYCHCLDCASAILAIMSDGVCGEAYNISNPESVVTIREIAELLAAAGGVELRFEAPSQAEQRAFNPMKNASLDAQKLVSLGWHGQWSAREGVSRTVSALKLEVLA